MNAEHLLTHFDRLTDAPDAIPRLRRFILDLAVRGKLMEQDPEDEPASELLKRIAAEKKRLVEAKEIRKPRHLDGAEAVSVPFEIPQAWKWVRLDAVGAIVGGGTPSANDAANFAAPGQGIPWLTPADLGGHSGLFISRGSRDLSETGLQNSSATLMPKGTVLFTSRAPIGYVAIAANPISTNQGFKSIVPYISDCSRFVALAMKSFAPEIEAKAPGTTFKEASGKIVAGVPFPLPPLAEQHRIVTKVDELMALCDRLETSRKERETTRTRLAAASLARLNAPDPDPTVFQNHAAFALNNLTPLTTRPDQIKVLRQTILNLAVRGKLVEQDPSDEPAGGLLKRIAKNRATSVKGQKRQYLSGIGSYDEVPYNIPLAWEWSSVGQLASDMRYGTSKKCDYQIRGTPVLRIPNVSKGEVDLTDLKFGALTEKERKVLILRENDLLVVRSNGSLDIVGRAAIVPKAAESMSFAGYLVRVRFSPCYVQARYVWLVMNSRHIRDLIEKPIRSTVGLKNVNSTELAALTIPLPPLAEQHRIVAKVDELMAVCDRLEASLARGEETRGRLVEAVLHDMLEA